MTTSLRSGLLENAPRFRHAETLRVSSTSFAKARKIKAILTDCDNTLIDFMRMKTLATNNAAKAMVKAGLKLSLKTAKKELLKTYLKTGIVAYAPSPTSKARRA
ncbi:MAG: hypothetical protein KJ955_05145 [Nanoarchaeota archaeon]|nr:hypothetical protein [Nanoarchaeota archaeon]